MLTLHTTLPSAAHANNSTYWTGDGSRVYEECWADEGNARVSADQLQEFLAVMGSIRVEYSNLNPFNSPSA